MTRNGMGDTERTVSQVYNAYDNLPPSVRKVLREAQLPWDPCLFAKIYQPGVPASFLVQRIRELDQHYMREETIKTYGRDHPQAQENNFS